MKEFFAIEVADGNGWEAECPDWEGVFFGDQVRADGAVGMVGDALVVCGARERDEILRTLKTSGDWKVKDYDAEGKFVTVGEFRPTYSWRSATDEEIKQVSADE